MGNNEIWKDVKDYEGVYQVSNLGRIKSLKRLWVNDDRIIKGYPDGNGYHQIDLHVNGRRKVYKVHRLIAMSFVPNVNNFREINHRNGIKTDNRAENLEWVTRSDNMKHCFATGLHETMAGERCGRHKLKEKDVIFIRESVGRLEYSQAALARKFNVSRSLISKIILGLCWTYLN